MKVCGFFNGVVALVPIFLDAVKRSVHVVVQIVWACELMNVRSNQR